MTIYSLSVSPYTGLTLTTTVRASCVLIEEYTEFGSLVDAEHYLHQNLEQDKKLSVQNKVIYTAESGEITRDDFIARLHQVAKHGNA